MNEKPITHIISYRGVEGFDTGYHIGRSRDVVVTGIPIPGPEMRLGLATVPAELADLHFRLVEGELRLNLEGGEKRIDEKIVYLGAEGAGPGYRYVEYLLRSSNNPNIKLAACDCEATDKEAFAQKHGLAIEWVECGGGRGLSRMARERLESKIETSQLL